MTNFHQGQLDHEQIQIPVNRKYNDQLAFTKSTPQFFPKAEQMQSIEKDKINTISKIYNNQKRNDKRILKKHPDSVDKRLSPGGKLSYESPINMIGGGGNTLNKQYSHGGFGHGQNFSQQFKYSRSNYLKSSQGFKNSSQEHSLITNQSQGNLNGSNTTTNKYSKKMFQQQQQLVQGNTNNNNIQSLHLMRNSYRDNSQKSHAEKVNLINQIYNKDYGRKSSNNKIPQKPIQERKLYQQQSDTNGLFSSQNSNQNNNNNNINQFHQKRKSQPLNQQFQPYRSESDFNKKMFQRIPNVKNTKTDITPKNQLQGRSKNTSIQLNNSNGIGLSSNFNTNNNENKPNSYRPNVKLNMSKNPSSHQSYAHKNNIDSENYINYEQNNQNQDKHFNKQQSFQSSRKVSQIQQIKNHSKQYQTNEKYKQQEGKPGDFQLNMTSKKSAQNQDQENKIIDSMDQLQQSSEQPMKEHKHTNQTPNKEKQNTQEIFSSEKSQQNQQLENQGEQLYSQESFENVDFNETDNDQEEEELQKQYQQKTANNSLAYSSNNSNQKQIDKEKNMRFQQKHTESDQSEHYQEQQEQQSGRVQNQNNDSYYQAEDEVEKIQKEIIITPEFYENIVKSNQARPKTSEGGRRRVKRVKQPFQMMATNLQESVQQDQNMQQSELQENEQICQKNITTEDQKEKENNDEGQGNKEDTLQLQKIPNSEKNLLATTFPKNNIQNLDQQFKKSQQDQHYFGDELNFFNQNQYTNGTKKQFFNTDTYFNKKQFEQYNDCQDEYCYNIQEEEECGLEFQIIEEEDECQINNVNPENFYTNQQGQQSNNQNSNQKLQQGREQVNSREIQASNDSNTNQKRKNLQNKIIIRHNKSAVGKKKPSQQGDNQNQQFKVTGSSLTADFLNLFA